METSCWRSVFSISKESQKELGMAYNGSPDEYLAQLTAALRILIAGGWVLFCINISLNNSTHKSCAKGHLWD